MQYTIRNQLSNTMINDNEIRKFQCANCSKSKLALKKLANQQHHGFACDECWTTIEKRPRYSKCSVQ
jgi:hypothetical protein